MINEEASPPFWLLWYNLFFQTGFTFGYQTINSFINIDRQQKRILFASKSETAWFNINLKWKAVIVALLPSSPSLSFLPLLLHAYTYVRIHVYLDTKCPMNRVMHANLLRPISNLIAILSNNHQITTLIEYTVSTQFKLQFN